MNKTEIFLMQTINRDGQGDVFYEKHKSLEDAQEAANYNMRYNPHNVCTACKLSDFDVEEQEIILESIGC